ncbi:MAG: hypothetical protein ACRC4M_02830 [Mycoplasma sp.]
MLKRKLTDFNVKVTENSKGYKVVVTEKEISTTRNTRVSFSPLKALATGKPGVRVIAGKKKQTTEIKDKDEMTLDKVNWSTQLERWAEVEGFDESIVNQISKEIRKIEIVKG